MSTVTEIVRDTALLIEREPRSVWDIAPIRETATFVVRAAGAPVSLLREVGGLNDAAHPHSYAVITDGVLIDDTVTRSVRRTRVLSEVARLNDRVVLGVRVTDVLRETAELNDTVEFSVEVAVRESARLDDTVTTTRTTSRSLREVARLRSRAVIPVTSVVRDVAELNDDASSRLRSRVNVREVAQVSETVSSVLRQPNILREVARFTSRLTSVMSTGGTLRDVAYFSDAAVPPSYGRAYTCSIVTWGMSTLSNFPFTTMAGKYGAGNNLWRLDGDDDYGMPISSHIATGVMDMGSDQMKRLSAVYVAGSSDEPVTVTVIGDVNGAKESYDYDLELRDQTDYRNNRALVGKGFRSRFVQFRIGGTAIKYKLLSAKADTSVTTRRV